MYLSHPVRRIRDDPTPGESVRLVVTAVDPDDVDALVSRFEDAGATIETRLRFGAVRLRIDEDCVATLTSLEGIESVETAATRRLAGGDAGEDV